MESVALVVAVGILAAALVTVSWKDATREAVRRDADHRLLLAVLDRAKASSIAEVAQADVIRESMRREAEMEAAVESELGPELQAQHERGYAGEVAQARAFMAKAGMDPDDDEDVRLWNSRLGTSLTS